MDSTEFLNRVLTGDSITPNDIDTLINNSINEDQYLDFKDGKSLEKKNRPGRMVRSYISAFANSAGGVLVIGINRENLSITGASAPGGGNLAEWASRALTPIAGHFTTQPRFQIVDHQNGEILLVGVDRSGSLVPIIEFGHLVYYIRIYDQTLEIPEYLISDLILGKRQQPRLRIIEAHVRTSHREYQDSGNYFRDLTLNINLNIGNESLVWADDVQIGMLYWAKTTASHIGEYILREIEVREETHDFPMHLHHHIYQVVPTTLYAFQNSGIKNCARADYLLQQISIGRWYKRIWKSAIYIISKNSLPVWYQLDVILGPELVENKQKPMQLLTPAHPLMNLTQINSLRPVVAVDPRG